MARPKKEINWELIEKRMESGCNAATIAFMHNIDLDTFYDRFKEHFGKGFADYSGDFIQSGRTNILFTQYMKALSGNTNMLTLLGKEWCGQGKDEVKTSPFQDLLELRHENMVLRAEIAEIKEKINANQSQAG